MKSDSRSHTRLRHRSPVFIHGGLVGLGILCLSSCGPKESTPSAGAPGGNAAAGDASKTGGASSAKPAPVVVPQQINLRKLPRFEAGELTGISPANVSYKAKGDLKSIYEFHKKQFLALGWKESPDSAVTDQYASGTFSGAGYSISASVTPAGPPGEVSVMLHNHGNINLAKLPLPAGTKPVYVGPLSAMHVTEAPVAETTEAVRKLLIDAGWEPHGNEGDSWHYKQGLNRISAMISAAPAQGGKTMINYSSELMTGDLPAPPDAQEVRYRDSRQELTFQTVADRDAILAYYKERLAKTGWKPNRDEPYRIDDYDEMVFRTAGGDVIFLKVKPEYQGKRNVSLGFLSAEDVAEMDKKADEEGKKYREKAEAEKAKLKAEAGKPAPSNPKFTVTMPAGASGVEQTKSGLKFTVGNGKAKSVAETWRKQFADSGWKEEVASLDAMAGMISFTKDSGSLTVTYTDTGFVPAEVNISGSGVELDRKE